MTPEIEHETRLLIAGDTNSLEAPAIARMVVQNREWRRQQQAQQIAALDAAARANRQVLGGQNEA